MIVNSNDLSRIFTKFIFILANLNYSLLISNTICEENIPYHNISQLCTCIDNILNKPLVINNSKLVV